MTRKAIYLGVFGLVLLLLISSYSPLVLPPDRYDMDERHSDNYKSDVKVEYEKGFADYLKSVESLISEENRRANEKPEGSNNQTVLELIKPFEWKSVGFDRCTEENKSGVLLIHGLTDSPFLMRDIGKHLIKNNCFLVRSILLPGHGTKPGHLLNVKSTEWEKATKFGVESFDDAVSKLYIAGFSTGGGLAINYALDNENNPQSKLRGLILFSPAIELSVGLAAIAANWHQTYSWAYEKGKWVTLAPEEDFSKYESFAKNAGDQVFNVTKKRKSYSSKLQVPLFAAVSIDDSTIKASGTISYFQEELSDQAYEKSKLLLYKRNNVTDAVLDNICATGNIVCVDSNRKKGIASYAHTALTISNDNFHYGENGDYYSCVHYIKDKENKEAEEKYNRCKSNSKDIWYAETFKEDAKGDALITENTYRRLTSILRTQLCGYRPIVNKLLILRV